MMSWYGITTGVTSNLVSVYTLLINFNEPLYWWRSMSLSIEAPLQYIKSFCDHLRRFYGQPQFLSCPVSVFMGSADFPNCRHCGMVRSRAFFKRDIETSSIIVAPQGAILTH